MNKYLHVDLSSRTFKFDDIPPGLFEEFIGGKGAGLKLLVDNGLITHDPFAEENPLIFISGPFTGSKVQTSARSTLVTKSPLTGTFLDSHIGGHFGPQVKKAGVDYIFITGKSDKPVYLYITPGQVVFEDAAQLWGKNKFATEKKLRAQYPDTRMISIGTAGENLVKYACIGTDYNRHFGRGGSGAVMGSKKLKAMIVGGSEKVSYFDEAGYKELTSQLTKDVIAHPNRALRKELGTSMWMRMGQEIGRFLPIRNCREVVVDDYEKITSESFKKALNWKNTGCFGCAILCSKKAKWKNYEMEGPEYETIAWLGANCGLNDPEAIAYANYLADDLGLDTISTGAVIAFAMEAFEKGIISQQDTGGVELAFGSSEAVFEMIKKIAARDGIGDILAEGTRIAAQKIGKDSDYFAIQTAGMELSGVNVKGSASMGLSLATADFASHTRMWSCSAEMNGELNFENTPKFIKNGQDEVNTRNCLVVCDFLPFGFDRLAPILNKMTGLESSAESLQELGRKISDMTRMYNIKNGRTRKDDTLPARFFKEKHLSGIFKDQYLTEEKFGEWLDMYYRERGWDENGIPAA
ncbi:MAG: aldehyde ferredoxin oxidoreductase family protein [Candidatus Aminicenantes bacterium]|nr:aldehyde ferredoxin oxidoreductase family protein [Candidatus Aminicenantes bacterium]